MADSHDQRDSAGRQPAPPSLPLHNRTPSGSQGIRMVPYSPPRIESQQSQYSQTSRTSQNSQNSQNSPISRRNSKHSHSYSHSHSVSPSLHGPTSPSPSSPRSSPRYRQQRRKRQSRELDSPRENADDGNDSDRTTETAASRRSKASRRSSWGPAAAFAAARSAMSAMSAVTGSGPRSGSSLSSSSDGDRRRHQRQGSVLTEKSANVMVGGNWTNAKKEGYAAQGPALSLPIGAEIPLVRGNDMDVSAHLEDYDATSNRPLAHYSESQVAQSEESSSTLLSSSLPRARVVLPPASASFSAAAASYLSEHSNNISIISNGSIAPPYSLHSDLPSSPAAPESTRSASPAPSYIPSSYPINYSPFQPASVPSVPSSSYQSSNNPLTVTNTVASSYALTAHSLSSSPSIGSLSSVASSQAAAPRPHSRRRNTVTIHPDKTFSLNPRAGSGSAQPSTIPASLKFSFSQSGTSSTIRSSVSHERLFSGPYGSVDQPSSPLSTAASATADDPSFDLSADFDSRQPWNKRLVGGLRTEPRTPDAKRKGKGRAYTVSHLHAQTQTFQSQYLPSLPETTSATTAADHLPESSARAGSRSPKSKPKKQISSASVQSFVTSSSASASALSYAPSTLSDNTNYKVYAHSSSPVARAASESLNPEDHPDYTESLLYSSPTHPGDSTNVEILGFSSPPAPRLQELQHNTDSEQSSGSLNSYPSVASFDTGISYNDSTLPNFVVIGASSPPAPAHYLDHLHNASDSELDTDADIDIPSSPPLPSHIADITTGTLDTLDSDENYVLHGEPSSFFLPPSSAAPTPGSTSLVPFTPAPTSAPVQAPPKTASSSSGSSLATISKPPRQVRSVYSRESLVVPPLKTVRAKRSNERFGYFKSCSRESLRRAASLKSLTNSIFNQEAASTFFAGQAFLNLSIPPVPVVNLAKTAYPQQFQQHLPALLAKQTKLKRKPLPLPAPPIVAQSENIVVYGQTPKNKNTHDVSADDSWESSPQFNPPSHPPSPSVPPLSSTLLRKHIQPKITVQMVEEHPHQWSSQLSTVMSESEDGSTAIGAASRSTTGVSGRSAGTPRADSLVRGDISVISGFSRASAASNGSGGRRSSVGWASSSHSRNLPSISSSLALQLNRNSRDSSLFERPSPALVRGTPTLPLSPSNTGGTFSPIRTVRDHDEDGDGLADLHDMSNQPSRSGLSGFFSTSSSSGRNLQSSTSTRSVVSGHFPSWARVYYGSGEHRALSVAGSVSDFGDDYMTGANQPGAFRRSLSADGPLNLFYARRRPHEVQPSQDLEAGLSGEYQTARPRGLRHISSSIWSPHLQTDRRATRFRVWDPPSVAWSDTTSTFDRRNMQVILFTLGFVMPLAWMAASFLPLPLDPERAMEKRAAEGEGEYGVAEALKQRASRADENRFQSARWWRTLNRVMSLFGLLVLGAIIALVVISVKQHWGQ